jgi:hypothetical protein
MATVHRRFPKTTFGWLAMGARTILVDRNGRGYWEIESSDEEHVVSCETLDEAKRVAYLFAVRRQPCELIVRDAYHRVVYHELIETNRPGDRPSNSTRHSLTTPGGS